MAGPVIRRYGGKVLARGPGADRLEGDVSGIVMMIEFETKAAATEFYYSDEYQAANYYTDTSGGIVDLAIDSDETSPTYGGFLPPGALKNEITNEQSYFNVNQSLRQIKIIRPNLITSIVSGYKKAIRE